MPAPILTATVDPEVLNRAEEFAKEFAQAQPFRHVVVDNFLQAEFCQSLMRDFPPFDAVNALNERGEVGNKATQPDIARLSPAYRRFDLLMRDPAFLDFMGKIAGIADLLYDPDYVGGGTHETRDGGDLDLHIDFNYHPRRPWHRRLNLIVFLNPEWDGAWGGCLELHRNAWVPEPESVRSVIPLANRAVLFETTEASWHGFTRVTLPPARRDLSRRSLAVYFYTRQRPEAETSTPHATVYVPPPLPPHLRPGHTLSDADVAALEGLLGRRDTQLQFLYDRERKFTTLIEGVIGSPSFKLGRVLTSPARWMRRLRGRF